MNNLSKSFTAGGLWQPILTHASATVLTNEILAVVGPSGCGKTTLLRMIAGIERLDSGEILFGEGRPRHIGYIPQEDALIPWKTGMEQIHLSAQIGATDVRAATDQALQFAQNADITGDLDKYPRQMSGGIKQRVNICRAVALDAELLLLDEPLSQVDYFNRESIFSWLYAWTKSRRRTVCIVTHEIADAIAVADRLLIFNGLEFGIYDLSAINTWEPRDRRKKARFGEELARVLETVNSRRKNV